MEDQITVNGRVFSIRRLLGKGKGGYSYLAADEHGEYVVKQIHHEPCEYYQFGDKLAAEQYDYARLLAVGIPMPRLLDVDVENERILKEYIPGSTAAELIAENRLPGFCLRQLKAMCARLYPAKLNIDYYPNNFVLSVDRLYYVDYECNDYSPEGISSTGAHSIGRENKPGKRMQLVGSRARYCPHTIQALFRYRSGS